MSNKQEFLGTEPLGRLLIRLSVPATIAFMVGALYNLVDTIFIGWGVGKDAIGGLSIALPAQMLIMAFGIAIGTGTASIISRNLGAGKLDRANIAAGNAFGSALFFGALTVILGLVFIHPLLEIMGVTPGLKPYAYDYLSVILWGSPFIISAMTANNIIRAEGKAKIAMATMLVGTGLNIVLDPVFILALNMGIKGAAIATVISQIASFLFISHYFVDGKSTIQFHFKYWKPDLSIQREMFILGFPAFARQAGQSLVTILLNNMLRTYGSDLYISPNFSHPSS